MKVTALILSLTLLTTACASRDSKSNADSPALDYECSFTEAVGCSSISSGKPAFAGLIRETYTNCREFLSFAAGDDLVAQFDYSSWATTQNSSGALATGLFTQWVNHAGAPAITLPQEDYKICSFIDINRNGRADLHEPLSETILSIGSAFYPLSSWTNF